MRCEKYYGLSEGKDDDLTKQNMSILLY